MPYQVLALALLNAPAVSRAQLDAEPMPGDPRLVVFSYDPNNSYRVFTRPLASTHIELAPDERVKVLALGDSAGWMTAARDNHVFIKPRYPNSSTSGTLITTRKTYQFVFRSTQENGRWYQRVSFQDPEELAIDANESDRRRLQQDPPAPAASEPVEPNGSRPYPRLALASSPEHLNFNYEIVGTAAFRPISVFDDGATTFIQFRPGIGDIPAVFRVVSGEGELELVEYAFKGQSLAIRRVLEAGLLKLGREEVRFYNRARGSRAAPSFFGEEGKR